MSTLKLATVGAVAPHGLVVDSGAWTEDHIFTLPGIGNGVAFSPDGQYLAAAHFSSPRLTVINTADWTVVTGTPSLPSTGYGVAFSPDGQYLAVAHANSPFLTVINTADWTVVTGTPILPGTGNDCAWLPKTDLPSRMVRVFDYAGVPVNAANAQLHDRPSFARFVNVKTDAGGEAEVTAYAEGDYYIIVRNPAGPDDHIENLTINSTSAFEPPLEVFLPYVGALVTLSGRVLMSSGGPADEVVFRAWESRKLWARVYTDGNGDWSVDVPPGKYDVTYIAEGCAPVVHGPYNVVVPE